ncbi:AIPR family protein [Bradyrhizobium sp.]|uniref:AIPR family protein n=1 Tax=Bradyrhizobium sp. TaxID=376 RepID=UPI0026095707|nr:AIPR family protein [Bradyrhizobium sp.]
MSAETKKLKARDEFVRFTEGFLKEKFGKLNAVQQSYALTNFYISEIHNRVRSEISGEDLELAHVDGANDLGCDLIHRDDNHVLIIQSKYRSEGAKELGETISHFQSILKRLVDPSLKGNDRLLDRAYSIDWKNDSFTMIFVTFGKLEGQARKLSQQAASYPSDIPDLESRCEWVYLDEQDLNEELRSARAIDAGGSNRKWTLYPIGQKGKRGASSIIEVEAGDFRSFIMALDAKQIVGAYEALGRDSLFSLNIRNFIGNTNTNKAIVKSAKEKAEEFFLFNNGISCLCRELSASEKQIDVTGLQVINGAQTVKALVNAARSREGIDRWATHPPTVLVRITEISGGYGASHKMREQITQFNNTQNVVKVSDFRSNDAVQENLKEQFKALTYRGRHVVYVPKRTDSPPKNSELVRLEEFAKTVYAFLEDPVAFSGSTSFLFDDVSGGYNKIFGDGQSKWERMPEDEFRLRAAVYWLAKEFGVRMREDRSSETDHDAKAALERKWVLIFAARKVFEHYYPNGAWKAQLRKLYKGDWTLGEDARGKILLQIYRDAKSGVITAYKISKKHDKNFVHRNWMRGRETPSHIAEILKDSVLAVREPLGDIPLN